MHGNLGPSNSCFKHGNSSPNSTTKAALPEKQKPQAPYCLRWSGGRAPRVICAPTFVPFFHLYTLAPLYLRPQSGWSPRFCYWTLVVHKASRPPNRGHVDAHKKRRQTQYRRISRAVERVLELEATLRERRRPKDSNRLRPPLQLHSFKNGICP